MTTVGDDFPVQQTRARELLQEYRKIGPAGAFAETGWLIERTNPTRWWTGVSTGIGADLDDGHYHLNGWTTDANCAVRFARREDAETVLSGFQKWAPDARAVEHAWLAGRSEVLSRREPGERAGEAPTEPSAAAIDAAYAVSERAYGEGRTDPLVRALRAAYAVHRVRAHPGDTPPPDGPWEIGPDQEHPEPGNWLSDGKRPIWLGACDFDDAECTAIRDALNRVAQREPPRPPAEPGPEGPLVAAAWKVIDTRVRCNAERSLGSCAHEDCVAIRALRVVLASQGSKEGEP